MTPSTPTLEQIAKAAGVSRSTVSRVINDEPNVSDAVRERVWRVVKEMGYHPHAAARSLAGRRTKTLGIVIPQAVNTVFSDPYFSRVLHGIADAANEQQYHMFLAMVPPHQEDDFYRRSLRSQMLEGVVIISAFLDDALIPRLHRDNIPFVVIGRHPTIPDVNYVDVDNLHGALMAVEHLMRLGRRRIATITGPMNMVAGVDRLEGYKTALRRNGHVVNEALIAEGDFTEAGGYLAMQQLLAQEPDAVFAANDLMAVGALRALYEADRRVPEDIAIVGFDDAQVAAYSTPPLTTVRQPIYQLGRTAAELLFRILDGRTQGPLRAILPTELVIRASCGSLR